FELSLFRTFVESDRNLSDARIVVVDRRNRVIHATEGSGYQVLQNLSKDDLIVESGRAVDGLYEYAPHASADRRNAQLVAEAPVDIAGWRVFVVQPLALLQLQVPAYYGLTLGLIVLALGAAVLGARTFSNSVTRPLEELVAIVRNISAN